MLFLRVLYLYKQAYKMKQSSVAYINVLANLRPLSHMVKQGSDPRFSFKLNFGLEAVEPCLLLSARREGGAGDTGAVRTITRGRPGNTGSTATAAIESSLALIIVDTDTPDYQAVLSDLLNYPNDIITCQVF